MYFCFPSPKYSRSFPNHQTTCSFSLKKKCQNGIRRQPHTHIKQTKHGVHFVLVSYSWTLGLTLECGWYAQWQRIGENKFFLCQVAIVNSILVRGETPWSTSPSQCWDPIWLAVVTGLCVLPQCLWVHLYISPVVSGRHFFHGVIHHLRLL